MNQNEVKRLFRSERIIMAVKNHRDLEKIASYPWQNVFLLYGNIVTLPHVIEDLKRQKRTVFVHEGLIEGLSQSSYSVEFIQHYTMADGIITTRPAVARKAQDMGLAAVLRFFILDSLSLTTTKQALKTARSDYIEILPGTVPRVIRELTMFTGIPIIAGGLIRDPEEAEGAFREGAVAVSSSNPKIWRSDLPRGKS